MESKVLLFILILVPLIDQGQGIPKNDEKAMSVTTVTDVSHVPGLDTEVALGTEDQPGALREQSRLCDCKGQRTEGVNANCLCQQYGKRSRKWATKCLTRKYENKRICRKFSGMKKGVNHRNTPSVPI